MTTRRTTTSTGLRREKYQSSTVIFECPSLAGRVCTRLQKLGFEASVTLSPRTRRAHIKTDAPTETVRAMSQEDGALFVQSRGVCAVSIIPPDPVPAHDYRKHALRAL